MEPANHEFVSSIAPEVMTCLTRSGILERGGEVRASVVPTRRKHIVQAEIRKHVGAHSAIYTDALLSYQGLKFQDFTHEVIDHAEKYVDGRIHTNGLENFWS